MTVGFVAHPSSLLHEMYPGHPERPERLVAIDSFLERTGLAGDLETHEPEPAGMDLAGLVHEASYLDLLERTGAAGGGVLDRDTSMNEHSLGAALRATQGAVDAVASVLDGRWTSAFVCTRPPGHHATPSAAMGFCLTNHVAVAARWAIASGRVSRVAVLDWDAHHGNGTQDAFFEDGSVLYLSLHQYPWYPGSGDATETGSGAGRGTTVNVPLPAGTSESAYDAAFDAVVEPAVADFRPELVLVSAGYDAHHADPLCMMRLTAGAFHRMSERAASWGPGPVCVLEGGYDLDGLAWSVGATLAALLGRPAADLVPPDETGALTGHPDAARWIERAVAVRRSLAG
jgi:acetoin utilization deacetylase AcuC-like enzyme